jgi:rhodanese-related sulfurtransferase
VGGTKPGVNNQFFPLEIVMSRKHNTTKPASSDPHRNQRKKRSGRNLAWLWVTIGALVIVAVAILFMQSKITPSVEITPAQAYAKFQQGAFFLDVRSQDEWNQFHIKGSTLIPLDKLPNRLAELPKDKDIVVVCLSGHRSQSGTTILQKAGFKRVSCLSGGLTAWNAVGYPLEGKIP